MNPWNPKQKTNKNLHINKGPPKNYENGMNILKKKQKKNVKALGPALRRACTILLVVSAKYLNLCAGIKKLSETCWLTLNLLLKSTSLLEPGGSSSLGVLSSRGPGGIDFGGPFHQTGYFARKASPSPWKKFLSGPADRSHSRRNSCRPWGKPTHGAANQKPQSPAPATGVVRA